MTTKTDKELLQEAASIAEAVNVAVAESRIISEKLTIRLCEILGMLAPDEEDDGELESETKMLELMVERLNKTHAAAGEYHDLHLFDNQYWLGVRSHLGVTKVRLGGTAQTAIDRLVSLYNLNAAVQVKAR